MSSLVHNHATGSRVQGSSMRGHGSEAQCVRRPPGPAAPSPRRSPRFRARWVALALEFLDEDDAGSVREQFDVETIGGVVAAAERVLRLLDGDGLKYGVAKQNLTAQSHLGICDSSYPLQRSPNTRLVRGYRQPTLGKEPALRYQWNPLRQ